ncbi:MAG: glycoside hydrolase family 99-like domain-containing protein, partial [Methanobacterium paludis]|nr:glycoside hydrolase family 99-like domain-containing protein [Methanobacterium paludis]
NEGFSSVTTKEIDPIIHYMYYGFKEGRRPNLTFDGDYYLKKYEDVRKSNLNPLIHYSLYGINEKRETSKKFPRKNVLNVGDKDKTSYISNLFYNAYHKSSNFVDYDADFSVELKQEDIKLIAFYLPQFHPFPENDKWWGKGFTEWTNVTKAIPLFVGHYQPHLPIDLGFYDLRLIETQKRQIELAKKYGIFGFCFHYYWFNGKRLMQTPLEIFLNNPKKLDFPFCICWANENWTKRWDGNDDEVLIAQKYSSDNDLEFIKDLSEYLRDDRYIKVNNKAIIMVYKPQLLPNPKKTFSSWRKYCKNEGIGELYIVGARRHDFTLKPRDYGLDAAVEFPPNHPHPTQRKKNVKYLNLKYEPAVFDLEKFVESKHNMIEEDYKTFKTVITSWDNTPRRLNEGQVYIGTPKVYKKWLKDAMKFSKENLGKNEQFVFINAWNEWAEGAHLEPDRKYGYAYLKATAESIIESRKAYEMEDNIGKLEIKYKVSVIMPTYNREGIIERAINSILNQTFSNLQLIICDDGSSDNTDKLIKEKYEKYLNNGKIIYFKQKNAGVSKARNAALKYADGNLIAYLDSDNYWHSHYLEKMLSAFDENNCNIVYCAMEVHDTSGTIYDKQHFVRNEPYDREKLVNANFIDLNVFMHKKFLYEELGGFNESLTSMVDWDLILRYTQHNKPFFLNEVLAQYF